MKDRVKWFGLCQEILGQFLPCAFRPARDIVDRFFRVKLGALPAGPIEVVDHMTLETKQTKLKYREQPNRARPDNNHIGSNCIFRHATASPPNLFLIETAASTPFFLDDTAIRYEGSIERVLQNE